MARPIWASPIAIAFSCSACGVGYPLPDTPWLMGVQALHVPVLRTTFAVQGLLVACASQFCTFWCTCSLAHHTYMYTPPVRAPKVLHQLWNLHKYAISVDAFCPDGYRGNATRMDRATMRVPHGSLGTSYKYWRLYGTSYSLVSVAPAVACDGQLSSPA
jgi:hypothetical protein